MNRTRTWVSALVIIIPCMMITLSMTGAFNIFRTTGSIYGRVTFNGRPLERGFVLFYPTHENSNDWTVGAIGKDGTYYIDSKWRLNIEETKYRICVIPRKGRSTAQIELSHDKARTNVVPVTLGDRSADSHQLASVDVGFPKKFTDVATSGLQITLGREPARIDIDLKD